MLSTAHAHRLGAIATAGVVIVLGTAFAVPAQGDADPVTQAVSEIRQEIEFTQRSWTDAPERLAALATMSYVQGHVTAPTYGFRRDAGLELPGGGTGLEIARESLDTRAGICGNAGWTFVVLMQELGYDARVLLIYYKGGGHVAAEVKWGGEWHFFDPTWGTMYVRDGEVLALGQVLELRRPGKYALTNETLLWRRVTRSAASALATGRAFLSHPDLTITDDLNRPVYKR